MKINNKIYTLVNGMLGKMGTDDTEFQEVTSKILQVIHNDKRGVLVPVEENNNRLGPVKLMDQNEMTRNKVKVPVFSVRSSWNKQKLQFKAAVRISGWTSTDQTPNLMLLTHGQLLA